MVFKNHRLKNIAVLKYINSINIDHIGNQLNIKILPIINYQKTKNQIEFSAWGLNYEN